MDWKLVLHVLFTNAILFIIISVIRIVINIRNKPQDEPSKIQLKKDDKILFAAGLIGSIQDINEADDTIMVKIADDLIVQASKYSVIEIL